MQRVTSENRPIPSKVSNSPVRQNGGLISGKSDSQSLASREIDGHAWPPEELLTEDDNRPFTQEEIQRLMKSTIG